MKVKFLMSLCGGKNYHKGDTESFEDAEAIRLVNAGFAEPLNKTALKTAVKKIEEKEISEKEKEKKASAILHKEELEDERAKLQSRVDEITNALGDAVIYYKPYGDLAADLEKQKSESKDENQDSNDNKENDLLPGEGEK